MISQRQNWIVAQSQERLDKHERAAFSTVLEFWLNSVSKTHLALWCSSALIRRRGGRKPRSVFKRILENWRKCHLDFQRLRLEHPNHPTPARIYCFVMSEIQFRTNATNKCGNYKQQWIEFACWVRFNKCLFFFSITRAERRFCVVLKYLPFFYLLTKPERAPVVDHS